MNGKKGDHPLTDILIWNLPTYSHAIDQLIKEIVQLGGRCELEESFDLFVPPPAEQFESELRALRVRLQEKARQGGWEI